VPGVTLHEETRVAVPAIDLAACVRVYAVVEDLRLVQNTLGLGFFDDDHVYSRTRIDGFKRDSSLMAEQKAVTPLKNGVQKFREFEKYWIPAPAGMTEKSVNLRSL
jgi:hypothetical protein